MSWVSFSEQESDWQVPLYASNLWPPPKHHGQFFSAPCDLWYQRKFGVTFRHNLIVFHKRQLTKHPVGTTRNHDTSWSWGTTPRIQSLKRLAFSVEIIGWWIGRCQWWLLLTGWPGSWESYQRSVARCTDSCYHWYPLILIQSYSSWDDRAEYCQPKNHQLKGSVANIWWFRNKLKQYGDSLRITTDKSVINRFKLMKILLVHCLKLVVATVLRASPHRGRPFYTKGICWEPAESEKRPHDHSTETRPAANSDNSC